MKNSKNTISALALIASFATVSISFADPCNQLTLKIINSTPVPLVFGQSAAAPNNKIQINTPEIPPGGTGLITASVQPDTLLNVATQFKNGTLDGGVYTQLNIYDPEQIKGSQPVFQTPQNSSFSASVVSQNGPSGNPTCLIDTNAEISIKSAGN